MNKITLEALREERRSLSEQLRAIDMLLAERDNSKGIPQKTPVREVCETSSKTPELRDTLIRPAIVSVLSDASGRIKPIGVRHELENRKFKYEGKTKLGARVRGELSLLRKRGVVDRDEDGGYLLTSRIEEFKSSDLFSSSSEEKK